MTIILFLIYTALFAASFLVGNEDIHTVIGIMSGVSAFYCFFRSFYLTARRGYYRKKYLGALLSFAVVVPYALFPARVASVLTYSVIALWHYILPGARLVVLRALYVHALKKACRARNYTMEKVCGGMVIRTPAKIYDVRLVGAHRRMGLVTLLDGTYYTVQWVPTYVAAQADFMQFLHERQERLPYRLLVGRARTRQPAWSATLAENPNTERVLLFLPGLCEWKFDGAGKQTHTNGSVAHGVRLYEADAFIEKLDRKGGRCA